MFGKFTVTGKTPKLSSSFGEKLQEVYTSDFVSLVSCCTSWLPIQTMTEEGNCHVVVQSDHFISHQKCVQMRELRRGVCTSCGLFDWTYSWSCLSACCWPMSSTCGALAFLLACANSPCSLHKRNLPVFLFKVEQRYWISKGSSNIFQIFCVQRALFISVPEVLHGFCMASIWTPAFFQWSHFLAEVGDAEQLLQSNRTILGQKSNTRSNVAQTWHKRGANVAQTWQLNPSQQKPLSYSSTSQISCAESTAVPLKLQISILTSTRSIYAWKTNSWGTRDSIEIILGL